MSTEALLDFHKRHSEAQNKYAYFLLAIAASAIAFAMQKTDGMAFSWSMLPLGAAIITWGASFYFGCQHLSWLHTALGANYGLLQLKDGVHPKQPVKPDQLTGAISGVEKAIDHNTEKASSCAIWQFRLLNMGAILFITWHLVEMWILTTTIQ